MWFAHKGDAYRLGYAVSENGVDWERLDHLVDFDVADAGFDTDMIEYAVIVSYAGRRFMFYNGNNYGFDGVGVAVEE
ncbi:MAG: hypothetical protein AAF360_19335 [Pseudomonadota bacterium]